ncbi:hypothetical protein TNCV_693061 [Trichonephila clavipes]|nr:hypothetical protein TNCV_693061 [Trichonephila clavipes]
MKKFNLLFVDYRRCHEFEPSASKDPPCRGEMPVKSVESSNVLLLEWGSVHGVKIWASTGYTTRTSLVPSPDPSPIENISSWVVERLTRYHYPANIADEVWHRLEAGNCFY